MGREREQEHRMPLFILHNTNVDAMFHSISPAYLPDKFTIIDLKRIRLLPLTGLLYTVTGVIALTVNCHHPNANLTALTYWPSDPYCYENSLI